MQPDIAILSSPDPDDIKDSDDVKDDESYDEGVAGKDGANWCNVK